MNKMTRRFEQMLEPAGIRLNGSDPWDVQVHNQDLFLRIARDGTLGLGEAYMDGWWDCEALDQMIARGFRAGLNILGRDSTSLPTRLLVGGVGLGGRVAAGLVADRLQADGLFLLGFPLHPQDKPDMSDAEVLFRTTTPTLFVQGTRDRRCDGKALRKELRRVGTPIELYDVEDADSSFTVPKKSLRTNEQIHAEVLSVLANWIGRRLR